MTAPVKMAFSFHSTFARMGQMPCFTQAQIAAERPLRFAPVPWAREHGGPILRAFIERLPEELIESPNVVVRALPAYLREGWAGGGLGWHLDSVHDDDWSQRRPQFWRACAQLGGIAATRIVEGEVTLSMHTEGVAWHTWQKEVDAQIALGGVREIETREGEIFMLNPGSLHSLAPAEREGHRIFLDCNTCEDWDGIPPLEASYDEQSNAYYARTDEERAATAAYGGGEG